MSNQRETVPIEIACRTSISAADADQIQAILIEAFPPPELEPFEDFARDIRTGARQLYLARAEGRVVGLAATRLLPDVGAAILEYLATDCSVRNRGLGARLVEATVAGLRAAEGLAAGLVIEVERDDEGTAEERQLRARRIKFYERSGALRMAAVAGYRMPSMIGGDAVPMKLLWKPIAPGAAVPAGEHLRRLVISVYRYGYDLAANDPLVQAALASIVGPSKQR